MVVRLLNAWERGDGFIDHLLDAELPRVAPGDRPLARELTYGVIRRRRWLDHVLRLRCRHDPRSLPVAVRNILRVGIYQLLYLDRVPHALIVDAAVRQVHDRRGGRRRAGFVNAVLRGLAREGPPQTPEGTPEALALAYSHPDWLVHRWRREFGERLTQCMLEWHNQIPPTVLAPNPLRLDSGEDLASLLMEEGIQTRPSRLVSGYLIAERIPRLTDLRAFREGRFFVQDESAGLLVRAASWERGPVLDLCAAPGGKAMAIAVRTGDASPLCALDRSPHRVRRIAENVQRLRLRSVHPLVGDARHLPFGASVPFVLVDAPCSGTGVLRRRPDLRWRLEPRDLPLLVRLQLSLLEAAATRVSFGGVLVYTTCSMETDENGGVIRTFLRKHREFSATPPEDDRLREMHRRRGGADKDPGVLIVPSVQQTDGGYVAVLRRKGRK
jgi:16S rRNA (cytosine967-C5)-methyltransferase